MSECKLTLWQKIKGLFMKYEYNRTVSRFEQLQKRLDELIYRKSDYWLN
jgi:hypothetical protein